MQLKLSPKVFTSLLVSLAFVLLAQGQNPFSNGLVGYYPFHGNANDESGLANHGTPVQCGVVYKSLWTYGECLPLRRQR